VSASSTAMLWPSTERVRPVLGSSLGPVTRVGPPAENPLRNIDRDGGISVKLSDGSQLWLFGDSAERKVGGGLAYFEIGTSAWAPADEPTSTRDAVIPTGPVQFIERGPGTPSCPADSPEFGAWPLAAVIDPKDPDRVLIWLANICLGDGQVAKSQGTLLVEWRYDPASPPDRKPIVAKVLAPRLFDDDTTVGAVLDAGNRSDLLAIGCRRPTMQGWGLPRGVDTPTLDPGACQAYKVAAADVAERGAYIPWTGSGWGQGRAVPMEMPERNAVLRSPPTPVGPFSIGAVPGGSGYVMMYSPWPGYAPTAAVRVARSPMGPWSPPVEFPLPKCGTGIMACYSANVQPDFSTGDGFGFGYYDRSVSMDPQLGSYLLSTVPLRIEPAR